MRVLSVIGVVVLGATIGASAILVPLSSREVLPTQAASAWLSGISKQAGELLSTMSAPQPSAETEASAKRQGQVELATSDTRTIEYLTQPASIKPAVDIRSAAAPWTAQVELTPAAETRRMTSSRPASDDQRTRLVRDLQTQLKRVGCYHGETNGDWGASSKRAMADFNDRVNATLPFEDPDYILLTLVQGHLGKACGTCPSGQEADGNGRCIPASVISHANQPNGRPKPTSAWRNKIAEADAAGATSAIAVPQPVPVPQPATAPIREAVAQEPAAVVRSVPPLPGRMAIGGPIAPPLAGEPPVQRPQALKVPAPAPIRVAKAATSDEQTDEAAAPVTAPPAPKEKAKVVRRPPPLAEPSEAAPVARPASVAVAPPAVRKPRPTQTVTVIRPQPDAKVRQRRMIYELFQSPERN